MDQLEATALAVSDLDSARYGKHLSSREVCSMISCTDRDEGVRRVLSWLLGFPRQGGEHLQGMADGTWVWDAAEGPAWTTADGVRLKVRACVRACMPL